MSVLKEHSRMNRFELWSNELEGVARALGLGVGHWVCLLHERVSLA